MTRIDDCRRSGDCELEFGCVCVCVRACLLFGLDRTHYYCVGGPVFGMM